jgi:hypothetical protein
VIRKVVAIVTSVSAGESFGDYAVGDFLGLLFVALCIIGVGVVTFRLRRVWRRMAEVVVPSLGPDGEFSHIIPRVAGVFSAVIMGFGLWMIAVGIMKLISLAPS